MPDFAAAAARHYQDAEYLHIDSRFATADHLAGLAAECALKALLLSFLGGSLTAAGIPAATFDGKLTKYNLHVNKLWPEMQIFAQGRTAARFVALIKMANPFAAWSIEDRYGNGAIVDQARATNHLTAAQQVVALLQQAQIDGVLS